MRSVVSYVFDRLKYQELKEFGKFQLDPLSTIEYPDMMSFFLTSM